MKNQLMIRLCIVNLMHIFRVQERSNRQAANKIKFKVLNQTHNLNLHQEVWHLNSNEWFLVGIKLNGSII